VIFNVNTYSTHYATSSAVMMITILNAVHLLSVLIVTVYTYSHIYSYET